MKKYTVDRYMHANVITITPNATFREAAATMLQARTNGLVVVDDAHHVVGMLSSWDMIQYLVPDYLEEDKHLASFEAGDIFEKRILEIADDPISNCMSTHVQATHPHHTLIEAATLMSEHGIRQLPVVDDSGKLLGYLNRTDIKQAIGDVLHLQA
jgi:CBS domain-containing protein